MNQVWSFCEPCENVLFCRQFMQPWNFCPFSLAYSLLEHTMSSLVVLTAVAGASSSLNVSRHSDEQGEFGVTCKAVTESKRASSKKPCDKTRIVSEAIFPKP